MPRESSTEATNETEAKEKDSRWRPPVPDPLTERITEIATKDGLGENGKHYAFLECLRKGIEAKEQEQSKRPA